MAKEKLRERFASCDIFYRLISFWSTVGSSIFCVVAFCCVRYIRHLNHIINKFRLFQSSFFFSYRGLSFSFLNLSANANHVIPRLILWLNFMIKSFWFFSFLFLYFPLCFFQSISMIGLKHETWYLISNLKFCFVNFIEQTHKIVCDKAKYRKNMLLMPKNTTQCHPFGWHFGHHFDWSNNNP